MTSLRRLVALAALALTALAPPAAARDGCGGAATPCEIAGGSYHLAVPEAPGPHPALVFFHGLGGSGAEYVGYPAFRDAALARGYALIAPNGRENPALGFLDWALRDRPAWRDEPAFLRAVLADAGARAPLDLARVVVAGFSRGAMLAWEIACAEGGRYAAYAPLAGAPPAPIPESCPGGPVRLFHMHGFADLRVPLEGGASPSGGAQGDAHRALSLRRAQNGCGPRGGPDRVFGRGAGVVCRAWDRCGLQHCLFLGGHELPGAWTTIALDWFERR